MISAGGRSSWSKIFVFRAFQSYQRRTSAASARAGSGSSKEQPMNQGVLCTLGVKLIPNLDQTAAARLQWTKMCSSVSRTPWQSSQFASSRRRMFLWRRFALVFKRPSRSNQPKNLTLPGSLVAQILAASGCHSSLICSDR